MSDHQPPPSILPPGYSDHGDWTGPRHRRGAAPLPPPPVDRPEEEFDEFEDDPDGRRERRRRHPVLIVFLAIVALVLLIGVIGFVWAERQINPGGHRGPAVSVVIPSGSSTSKIGSILAKAGVIHEGTLFAWYVRITGDGPLLAGSYSLPKNMSYSAAISALKAGPVIVTHKLVIPEGYTVRQIAEAVAALPGMHLSATKFLVAVSSGEVRSPYEPPGRNNLEGLLFPDTYSIRPSDNEVTILEEMIGEFNDQAQSLGLTTAAAALHMTPYQVITVASIVERESKLTADRGPVASTLYNRLRAHMPLGADSTQTYYLRLQDPTLVPTPSQLDEASPYNTRVNLGLPPTPISNPGLASLQAAAAPPATSYLYFVQIQPDGKLGFASSSAGFSQLQAECRAAGLC